MTPAEQNRALTRVRSATSPARRPARPRMVLALTLVLLAATTGGTIAATGGGSSGHLSASVTQYNSQCYGPGNTPGSDCHGENLPGCSHDCNGNNSPNCAYNCWGNNSSHCSEYCYGNNSPRCAAHCYGANSSHCNTDCHKHVDGAPTPPADCRPGQTPSSPGTPGMPASCYETGGKMASRASPLLTAWAGSRGRSLEETAKNSATPGSQS